MTETVVRARRPQNRELAADEAAAKQAIEAATQRHLNDLRVLLQYPEFVRYARHWIGKSGAFAISTSLNGSEVIQRNAQASLGQQMWNEIAAAEPQKVLQFLDLTVDKEDPANPIPKE